MGDAPMQTQPSRLWMHPHEPCWAYVDPKGNVQRGFSSALMLQWLEHSWFDGDVKVALMPNYNGGLEMDFRPLKELYPEKKSDKKKSEEAGGEKSKDGSGNGKEADGEKSTTAADKKKLPYFKTPPTTYYLYSHAAQRATVGVHQ